jgi:methionine aminopeptidase
MTVFQSTERGIAEPTSINANNCVSGYAPLPDDQGYVLAEGDVVTVAMGVHIDGYAVLSSQTTHVQSTHSPASGPVANAVCALHYAVRGIINELSTGSAGQIHDILREVTDTFGVSVVQGSQLRRIRRFLVGQSTIEELDEKAIDLTLLVSNEELSVIPGEVYLLDLAISTASGMVHIHPLCTKLMARSRNIQIYVLRYTPAPSPDQKRT